MPAKISPVKYSSNTLKWLDCKIIATRNDLRPWYLLMLKLIGLSVHSYSPLLPSSPPGGDGFSVVVSGLEVGVGSVGEGGGCTDRVEVGPGNCCCCTWMHTGSLHSLTASNALIARI